MKIYLDRDEWYPVYTADVIKFYSGYKEVDMPEEEYEAYNEVCRAFDIWQDRLSRAYKTGEYRT